MTERTLPKLHAVQANPGAWLIAVSAAAGLIASLIYHFSPGDGIAFTPGTLLVIISTALLLAASLVMATGIWRHWLLDEFLLVATFLDILGTVFAAWLLEAHWLLGLMVLAAVGWIVQFAFGGRLAVTAGDAPRHLQEASR